MDTNKMIARAKAILLSPRTEWPAIAAETDTIGGIYTRYLLIMAAIPAVIQFLRMSVIGMSVPLLGTWRMPMGTALTSALTGYVLTLVGIFIIALIVEALAPTFGGQKDRVQAVKVVAYSYTANFVAAIIGIVPGLLLLSALAGLIYGLYLLNMGLPHTMKCPPEKSLGYTVVTVIAAIVVSILISFAVHAVAPGNGFGMHGRFSGLAPSGGAGFGGGNSGGSFSSGSAGAALQSYAEHLQAASKQLDAAQKSGDANAQSNAMSTLVGAALGSNGKVESLPPDRIKPFLPDTLAGLPRTQASAERNAAMGVQISKATGTYSDGAARNLTLEIADTGSLKGLLGFAAGYGGVEQEKESDTGYDKTYKSGGQLVHEQWDKTSQSGEYSVVIADRFSVTVRGKASSIDDLKAAAASVNTSGLAALKDAGVTSSQ